MSIFELGKAVTRYDEKDDDKAFADDVKIHLVIVTKELATFCGLKSLGSSKAVQVDTPVVRPQYEIVSRPSKYLDAVSKNVQ